MQEHTDSTHVEICLNELACEAYTHGFDIVSINSTEDWVSPGDYIVHVYMRRHDLELLVYRAFRSNGKRVNNNHVESLRTKVRRRHRQLVNKMERRLNRTTPDNEGLYRRMTYDDC